MNSENLVGHNVYSLTTTSDSDGSFDVERIGIMEQIITHFTGTTTFDKSRLRQIAAGLHHRRLDDQPSTCDADSSDSAEATSEDEEFTISAVSPTTARTFAIEQNGHHPAVRVSHF